MSNGPHPTTQSDELPSEAERAARYEAELIRRYRAGLPLSVSDKKDARAAIARIEGRAP